MVSLVNPNIGSTCIHICVCLESFTLLSVNKLTCMCWQLHQAAQVNSVLQPCSETQPGKIVCNVEMRAHNLPFRLPELQRKLCTNRRQLHACACTGLSVEFLPLPWARHVRCVAGVEVYSILQPCSLVVEFLGSTTSDFVALSLETFSRAWLVCSLKMLFQYYYLWAVICRNTG